LIERFMIFLTPYTTAKNRLGTLCGRLVEKADAIAAIRPATGAECAASQGSEAKKPHEPCEVMFNALKDEDREGGGL